jgi:flavin reductase (DIM6/NTAB) family NADH-FMN oxidoreductase RutF
VTCKQAGVRYAMAATAVSEVSLDPPSMLVCVNRSASMHAPLSAGAEFCINILHASHERISILCGGSVKGEARFANGNWLQSEPGVPYLGDAQASFFCRTETSMTYGSHAIFIGRVTRAISKPDVDPLIFCAGRYSRVRLD